MVRHGLHRRVAPGPGASTILSNIEPSQATGSVGTSIVAAPTASVLTVITTQFTIIPPPSGTAILPHETVATTISITDPASFAALTASTATAASSSISSHATSTTAAAAGSTSSHAAKSSSSSNLSTIIPAIVVPIAVILLASFAAFWFFMRRRHHRDLKNTEFVMAGKGEKLSSRSNSSRSGTTAEKSYPVVAISEVKAPSRSGPKISLDDIGVARPLTPKDSAAASRPRSPNRQYGRPSHDKQRYQNFSGPRPNTARNHPPSRNGESQGRNRSNSSPGNRGPPPSAYPRDLCLPAGPPPRAAPSPVPRSGPSPVLRSDPSSVIGGPQRGFGPPRPAPAPPGPIANRLRDPSPGMDPTNRAAAPAALEARTGAYNGASSISQYSPIIKETPKPPAPAAFRATSASTSKPTLPTPLQTRNLTDTARSQSPASPTGFLTEENMRIARLGNSSRLGFFNTSTTSPSADMILDDVLQPTDTHIASPATASNASPKLPPPATRSQLIPTDPSREERKAPLKYFNGSSKRASGTSSHYPTTFGTPRDTYSRDDLARHHDDNASVVSDLEAYEDIDAKSDVSSLNEFERFDFESRNESRAESARGSVRSGNQHGAGWGMGPFGR